MTLSQNNGGIGICRGIMLAFCLLSVAGCATGRRDAHRLVRRYPDGAPEAVGPVVLARDGQMCKDGTWTYYYDNGKKMAVREYMGDLVHGPSKGWHKNGRLQFSGNYEYGQRQGEWVYWHDNGKKHSQGIFIRDRKTGIWQFWDESGALVNEEVLVGDDAEAAVVEDTAGAKISSIETEVNEQYQARLTAELEERRRQRRAQIEAETRRIYEESIQREIEDTLARQRAEVEQTVRDKFEQKIQTAVETESRDAVLGSEADRKALLREVIEGTNSVTDPPIMH